MTVEPLTPDEIDRLFETTQTLLVGLQSSLTELSALTGALDRLREEPEEGFTV